MRRGLLLALLCVIMGAASAPARADLFLGADASVDRGYIKLYAVGSSDLGPLTYAEDAPLGTLSLAQPIGNDPRLGPLSAGTAFRAAKWRCDRLDRRFTVTGTRADGTVDTAAYEVRTPSCRNRLALSAPGRVEPGEVATATVTDTWGLGDSHAEACVRKPGGRAQCAPLRFTGATATFSFTPHGRKRYLVTVRAPAQRLRRSVSVGLPAKPEPSPIPGPTVLTTGDSMMGSIDAILGDRLAKRAEVVGDVKVGASISSDVIVDWAKLARQQVAAQQPEATVVFLGTNDRYPMTTPGGATVACCGADWGAEYTRRVRGIMRTYAQDGRGTVVWLTVPAARDSRRAAGQVVVNAALRRAAAGLPTVQVLDLARVFTPDGTYRATMVVRGRRVRIRESDGLHLSIAGAKIAAGVIIGQLEASGIL